MNRKDSENTINLFGTPMGSPRQSREHTRNEHTGAHQNAPPTATTNEHTPAVHPTPLNPPEPTRPTSEAPPYTTTQETNPPILDSRTGSVLDFRDAPGDTASVAPTTASSRRRIADSIKTMFRRQSHSSSRKGNVEFTESEKSEGHGEHKEQETTEEMIKKLDDPQHLLNTILEEPEELGQDLLIPVSDAAAVVAGDDSISSHHNGDAEKLHDRRKGYRENLMRNQRLKKYTKASKAIMKMRKWLSKFMAYSLLTRTFIYWFPLAVILFIPLGIGAWNKPNIQLGDTRVMWIFIWLEVVWGSLWISRIFSYYMPMIFGYLISIFSPKYFKYVNMVYALQFAIQLVLWTFISFISFSPILYDNTNALSPNVTKQPHWQKVVQDVCVALLVSAIVFFVEQAFLYLLSTSFHRTRMALRIQKQKRCVNVLIILFDAALQFFPWHSLEFDEEDNGLEFALFNKKKAGSKSKNKVIRTVGNLVGSATKNVEQVIASTKQVEKPVPAKVVNRALAHRDTREILANRIWKSLVIEDSTFLTYEDLIDVFGEDRKEEVLFIFDVLDKDGMNGIDLDEMIESVNQIGRENKQIQKSLVDIDGAITKLHYLLMCIGLVLIVVIFVGMLAPSSATVLATLGSTLLSMSFLFSATAQEVFQSCIFLFVKHPFDIGDFIQTNVPGVGLIRMKVVELNLMYTVFEEGGTNIRRQISNAALTSAFIDNVSRSPPSAVATTLVVGVPETTVEQLAEFETRLNEFVESNPRDYMPGVFFQATNQTDMDRLSVTISISTRNNQDDMGLFSNRRTKVYEFISQCINEIPISIPRREDTTNHDPSLPLFHYKIKNLDEAIKFTEKSKKRRQTYGMRPPMEEDEYSLASDDEQADGYHNNHLFQAPTNSPPPTEFNFDNAPPTSASASYTPHSTGPQGTVQHDGQVRTTVRKATSFSSKMSRHSRAFSTMSKNSQTHGLRARRTNQHPLPKHKVETAKDEDVTGKV